MKIKIISIPNNEITFTKVMTEDGKIIGSIQKLSLEQAKDDFYPTCTLTIACPQIELTALAHFELDEEYEKLTSEFSQEDLAKMLIALRKDYIRLLNEETNRQMKMALNSSKDEKEIISQSHYKNTSWSEEGEIK